MAQAPVAVPKYPDVPQGSGVPSIFRSPTQIVFETRLIEADALTIFGAFTGPQWGIFSQYGAPAAVPDTFISVDYRKEWRLSDYPVEQGGFQTYDKVATPFDVRVRMACDGTTTTQSLFLTQIDNMATSFDLWQVITPDATFKNVNIVHYDYRRERSGGVNLIIVDIWLSEVRATVQTQFSNTKDPTGVADVNGGTVQPVAPTPAQSAQVQTLAGSSNADGSVSVGLQAPSSTAVPDESSIIDIN